MQRIRFLLLFVWLGLPGAALAEQGPTPGFPEAVVQWGAQKGETCAEIARALYGSPKYAHLLLRYNRISCAAPMPEAITLIAPAKVTSLPTARLRSMHPDVQTRPPGGSWSPGAAGQPLGPNYSVQTQDQGRADVEFIDRTRVFLAPRTLVVIFDTASQTRVSKVQPPRVEIQEGEVQAGLAALRGAPVEVAVSGGGQVSAVSRDTVIARKGERTTVAVFDGKAGVTSAGKKVEVPTNHGTRFVQKQPPEPPRPLPPAPVFKQGTSGGLILEEEGHLQAVWEPVINAASYRVEVAREEDFRAPLVREEVPAEVTSFRGEKLPAGRYFLRVRAIDKEDFLGVAATRAITLVTLRVTQGRLQEGKLVLRRKPQIEIQAPTGVEIAADDGPFGPVPSSLVLPSALPRKLRLRGAPDQPSVDIPVEAEPIRAFVDTIPEGEGKLQVRVRVEGRTPEEALAEANLRARVTVRGVSREIPLERLDDQHLGVWITTPPGEQVRVEILDDGGALFGAVAHEDAAPPPAAPSLLPPPPPVLGAVAPIWAHQVDAVSPWRSPRVVSGVTASVLAIPGERAGYQLDTRGSGVVGPIGLDLALRSRISGERTADGVVWSGARLPLWVAHDHSFEVGAMLHAPLPPPRCAADPPLAPALGLAGGRSRLSGVIPGGGRGRLNREAERTPTAAGQGFLVAGVALKFVPWLRAHLAADGRYLMDPAEGQALRVGGALGLEAGTAWFAGMAARAGLREPAQEGATTIQLTLGFREHFL
ncbi:MAG: hypothetical protein RMJ98_10655 [Myxococcales bacterium]|nr:hypothetical protein [Myxococcales bacterium]